MVITNAIYFKGTWVTQFAEEDTAEADFWKDSSNSIQTDFMNVLGTFNYTAADGVNVLEMPYEGDRLSMLVMLPNDVDGIGRVEDMLSADLVEQWRHGMGPIEVKSRCQSSRWRQTTTSSVPSKGLECRTSLAHPRPTSLALERC